MYAENRAKNRERQRNAEMADDLHERQKQRVQQELDSFNRTFAKGQDYLRITNNELRSAVKETLYGGTLVSNMGRLAGAIEHLGITEELREALARDEAERASARGSVPDRAGS
jgi:hypothetical protein